MVATISIPYVPMDAENVKFSVPFLFSGLHQSQVIIVFCFRFSVQYDWPSIQSRGSVILEEGTEFFQGLPCVLF